MFSVPSSRATFRRPRALFVLAAVSLTSFGVAACGGEEGAGEQADLTVYSGRDEELVGPLFDQFEEEAGMNLEVRYGESAELAATIVEEGENSPADVFLSQDAGSLGALQDESLLAQLPDGILGEVEKAFRSTEGNWVGISGRARVVAYNTEAVDEAELPDSVLELTDPEWEGRVGWAPTNASFQAFVTAMRLVEGEDVTRDWLERMVANGVVDYADNVSARDGVAGGEVDVALINHYYVAQAQEEEGEGYPVDVHFTSGGDAGSLVNVAGAGVVEGSKATEEANGLLEFLLEADSQEYFADEVKEYPLAAGTPSDPDLVPLAEIEHPDIDLSNLDDLQGTLLLIEEAGAL